MIFFVSLALM